MSSLRLEPTNHYRTSLANGYFVLHGLRVCTWCLCSLCKSTYVVKFTWCTILEIKSAQEMIHFSGEWLFRWVISRLMLGLRVCVAHYMYAFQVVVAQINIPCPQL
jgi:hypothetical protein